jgi:hypothetical protein
MDIHPGKVSLLDTRIGTIELDMGQPATDDDVRQLLDASDFQRACQAYLWSLPLVGMAQWQHAARTVLGMRDHDVVVYESLADQLGILMGDGSRPYVIGLPELSRTGALVIDYPAGSSVGVILDFWQRRVQQMGDTGPDGGAGGTYLVVGPGQKPLANVSNYVVRSPTSNILVGFRPLDHDPARANMLIDHFRMYSYGAGDSPDSTVVLRPGGRAWSQVPPRGLAYWERLSEIIQRERPIERDRVMMSMLQPIGIERGRAFAPSARQRRLLEDAALVGELMARAMAFRGHERELRFRQESHWREVQPYDSTEEQQQPNMLDARAEYFYQTVAANDSLCGARPGSSEVCLVTHCDASGHALDGAKSYRLRLPVHTFPTAAWTLTVYEADQRVLMNNGMGIAARSSRDPLRVNADGTVDLYVGPTAPTGWERNAIISTRGSAWFALVRLSELPEPGGARPPRLPDFELVYG